MVRHKWTTPYGASVRPTCNCNDVEFTIHEALGEERPPHVPGSCSECPDNPFNKRRIEPPDPPPTLEPFLVDDMGDVGTAEEDKSKSPDGGKND